MSSAPCRADWMISAILMWKLTIPASISGITRTDHLSQTPALFRETSAAETAHRMASLRLHTNRKMPHLSAKIMRPMSDISCRLPTMSASTMQAGAAHLAKRSTKLPVLTAVSMCLRKRQKTVSDSTGRHSGNCLLPGTGYADGRKHTHLQCILL